MMNSTNTPAVCACKDRPLAECPGEWEPGCDLGNNPKYVRRYVGPAAGAIGAVGEPANWMHAFEDSGYSDHESFKAGWDARAMAATPAAPQAEPEPVAQPTAEEARREIGKWLNERPNRDVDPTSLAVLCAEVDRLGAELAEAMRLARDELDLRATQRDARDRLRAISQPPQAVQPTWAANAKLIEYFSSCAPAGADCAGAADGALLDAEHDEMVSLLRVALAQAVQPEPVAWLDAESGEVMSAKRHAIAANDNGLPGKKIAAQFSMPLYPPADGAVAQAVAAERERCALLCEKIAVPYQAAGASVALECASGIRAGLDQKGGTDAK